MYYLNLLIYKLCIMKISTQELIDFINSDHADWHGTDHGDTVQAYQGRKAQQVAAALLLIGREMETGEPVLSEQQASDLFFNYLRGLLHPDMVGAESGTSRFCVEICLNQWKTAAFYRGGQSIEKEPLGTVRCFI